MREILFRGKRVDNGEWVYGHYGEYTNMRSETISAMSVPNKNSIYGNLCYDVDPSTVGQYTGLTDKNGKKIFEGDIVEYPIESGGHKGENIHEVVFENRHGTAYFGIKMSNIETWGFDMEVPSKLMKVIGNIHDDPELLEVEE